jgi:T5SS/PEP-CTERM-associated repeat protein
MNFSGSQTAQAAVRCALIAMTAWGIWGAIAHAVTTNWIANDGSFTNAANWDNGVPDGDDTAIFNRGFVAYTVTVPGSIFGPPPDYVINRLRVNTNEVTLADSPDANRPSLTVVNRGLSIVIGENAGDVAIVNSTLRSVSGVNASIGHSAGATGTLNISSGTFSMSDFISVGYTGSGTLNVAAGGQISSSDLYVGKGTMTIQNGGTASTARGFIGLSMSSSGIVTVAGAGSTWTNSFSLQIGLNSAGRLSIEAGGNVSTLNSYIHSGEVAVIGLGSTWTNASTLGVYDRLIITDGGAVSSASAEVGVIPGTPGDVTVDGPGSSWTNSGDLTLGDYFQGSTLTVSGGGAVSVGGNLIVERSGVLSGNGTISGNVMNRGAFRPGLSHSSQTAVPGTLHIDGNFLQSDTGYLLTRLGGTTAGTHYDQLQVSGAVNLNGIMSVPLVNGFMPSAGDAFDILDWSSVSGRFSTVFLPSLKAGLSWDTSQLYTTGIISVVNAPLFEADFDEDGDVDGDDLSQWRSDFGQNAVSDANGDGDSDGTDFLAWQRQVGSGASSVVGAAVPEPEIAGMVCPVAASAAVGGRRFAQLALACRRR